MCKNHQPIKCKMCILQNGRNTMFGCWLFLYWKCLWFWCELCCIRPYLDFKTASTIATSTVHSKLDYCNSLYHKLPNYQLNRLQQIQNSLVRDVVKAPKSSHITLHSQISPLAMNALNINFFLLTTKFLQPVNLAILTIWSLFNPLAVLYNTPYMLSPFLAHRPSPHWKSQIANSDMHHPISGINSEMHSVSLASHVSTHLLIHLSAHLCHYHHSHHPSQSHLHSFTPGSKSTFSTNRSHLNTSFTLDCLHETGLIMLLDLFLVFFFHFSVRPVWWPKLVWCQLFTAR